MPYTITQQGNKYMVRKRGADGKPTGAVLGTHPSATAARDQITAITISEQKAIKAYSPEAQRIAGTLLNALSNVSLNSSGDTKVDQAFSNFMAACYQYEGFWRRIVAGQRAGDAASTSMNAARAIRTKAQSVVDAAGGGTNARSARAMTIAISASQLARALSTGKSAKSARAPRTLKAWRQIPIVRMNLVQLKREYAGLRAIQLAARQAIGQLNNIQQSLAKANQMLPEDNALGEAMHEIGVALAVLSNERHLTPMIAQARDLLKQKQQTEAGLQELRNPKPAPQQQKPRGGLFGLFGRGR